MDVVYKHFVCFVLHGAAPIPMYQGWVNQMWKFQFCSSSSFYVCVAEVWTHIFNMFFSSTNVHLQYETCSSPVRNVFISSAYIVRLQHKMCLSLVINMFICSVILYLEVISTDIRPVCTWSGFDPHRSHTSIHFVRNWINPLRLCPHYELNSWQFVHKAQLWSSDTCSILDTRWYTVMFLDISCSWLWTLSAPHSILQQPTNTCFN